MRYVTYLFNFNVFYLETGDSALITFTIILPTSLHSVFSVARYDGGNFMGMLRIRATMLHFLQAVGFSQTSVILPLLGNFEKSQRATISVCLSVRTEQLSSHFYNFYEI